MILTAALAALVPGAVAAVLLAIGYRAWDRSAGPDRGRPALPLALFAAFLAGHVILRGWPTLPPVASTDRLAVALAAVALLAAVGGALRGPLGLRLTVRGAVSLAVPWFVLGSLVEGAWSTAAAAAWVGGSGAALFAVWTAVDALAPRAPGRSLPLALLVASAGLAAALAAAGSALAGQLAGTLAAGLGAVFLLTLRRPDVDLGRDGLAVTLVGYAGLVLVGHFYADLPLPAAALLFLAPALPWAAQLPALRGRWLPATVRVSAVLVPVALALWLALRPPAPGGADGSGSSSYYYTSEPASSGSYDYGYGRDSGGSSFEHDYGSLGR
jgi:hypothetical protein